jgi:hypothetical protein
VRRIELPLGAEGHMPPKEETQLTATERAALWSFVRGLAAPAGPVVGETRPTPATPPTDGTTLDTTTGTTTTPAATPSAEASPDAPVPVAPSADTGDRGPADPDLVARLPARVDLFATAVSALLAERCSKCHTGTFPAGNLSVANRAALLRGGNDGPALVPGDLQKSTLWQRVSLPLSDSDHMPPEQEPQLSADELALLRSFVLEGGADGATVTTSELWAGAVRALAARAPVPSAPPAAAPRTAGCGACTVGGPPEGSALQALPRCGAFLLMAGLALRRRARRDRRTSGIARVRGPARSP